MHRGVGTGFLTQKSFNRIIVGVKYCFRYNSRNRQMRMTGEDGEPITLENMHPRPRRRREKKLMTMDEVNEKFPMMKYKNWVAQRAKEGLPTAGGVSTPPSRANSIRSVHATIAPKERDSTEDRPTTSATASHPTPEKKPTVETETKEVKDNTTKSTAQAGEASGDVVVAAGVTAASKAPEPTAAVVEHRHSSEDEEEEDDEHINPALPPELLGAAGDTCAICIDTLENDDDVRGLTCGHAFHASCLDPWLTSRRACCPLCKADYYTPKPRPPPPDGTAADPNAPGGVASATSPRSASDPRRMNMPSRPGATTWYGGIRGHRMMLPGRLGGHQTMVYPAPGGGADYERARREGRLPTAQGANGAGNANNNNTNRFRLFSHGRRTNSFPQRQELPAAAQPQGVAPQPEAPLAGANATSNTAPNVLSSIRIPRITLPSFGRARNAPAQPAAAAGEAPVASGANVTPSQLEAGTRAA